MASRAEDLSARRIDSSFVEGAVKIPDLLVSADSHIDEPATLWDSIPLALREELPKIPTWTEDKRPQGGLDPKIRIEHMDLDRVAAEVLYPTTALRAFAAPQKAQEQAFRLYNDWVADYCKTAPDRLFAVPCLCVHDIDWAVAEMQRCNDMGLLGGLVWQVPHPDLPFTSDHYDRLWAAAAEIGLPINFHILSGHSYDVTKLDGIEIVRASVNIKTANAVTTIFDMIWSGVFNRHPKLRIELVESEIGWIPFTLQQWDYYYNRFNRPGDFQRKFPISRLPSEIFDDHVYATFMDDFVGAQTLSFWGDRNCMWSSDYPHGNMTWPNSRAFIAKQIGALDLEKQTRLISQNVIDLYGLAL
jgi:predicted TIM-barrel fold metal-dependent hydrolase